MSWKKTFQHTITNAAAADFATITDMAGHGYVTIPPVEETLTEHLAPNSAAAWKSHPVEAVSSHVVPCQELFLGCRSGAGHAPLDGRASGLPGGAFERAWQGRRHPNNPHPLDWFYDSLSSPPVAGVWWAHWCRCPVAAVASSKWMLHTGGGWGEQLHT